MTVVTNLNSVARKLDSIASSDQYKDVSVIVGYSASYAASVHERQDIPHKVGQAKFLEQPARENQDEYGRVIVQAFKTTQDMKSSLLLGGLRLQRDSQKLVPVDTGFLRNSSFTKAE